MDTDKYIKMCLRCGREWKENIRTNDDSNDPSWMLNALC